MAQHTGDGKLQFLLKESLLFCLASRLYSAHWEKDGKGRALQSRPNWSVVYFNFLFLFIKFACGPSSIDLRVAHNLKINDKNTMFWKLPSRYFKIMAQLKFRFCKWQNLARNHIKLLFSTISLVIYKNGMSKSQIHRTVNPQMTYGWKPAFLYYLNPWRSTCQMLCYPLVTEEKSFWHNLGTYFPGWNLGINLWLLLIITAKFSVFSWCWITFSVMKAVTLCLIICMN